MFLEKHEHRKAVHSLPSVLQNVVQQQQRSARGANWNDLTRPENVESSFVYLPLSSLSLTLCLHRLGLC